MHRVVDDEVQVSRIVGLPLKFLGVVTRIETGGIIGDLYQLGFPCRYIGRGRFDRYDEVTAAGQP